MLNLYPGQGLGFTGSNIITFVFYEDEDEIIIYYPTRSFINFYSDKEFDTGELDTFNILKSLLFDYEKDISFSKDLVDLNHKYSRDLNLKVKGRVFDGKVRSRE